MAPEYETDYDDDGYPIKVRITKAVLKARLADVTKQLSIERDAARSEREKRVAAEHRLAARTFGAALANAIGSGPVPYAVEATLNVDHDTVDVSSEYDFAPRRVPGMISARLNVEFHGDPNVLQRLGKVLVERPTSE